jgi:DNA-directed RNA polymerase subunit beta
MTPSGTFVIMVLSVLFLMHRSPGVFFGQSFHANGTKLYSARVIPFKGSWIEFSTDINSNVRLSERKKLRYLYSVLLDLKEKDILEILILQRN